MVMVDPKTTPGRRRDYNLDGMLIHFRAPYMHNFTLRGNLM